MGSSFNHISKRNVAALVALFFVIELAFAGSLIYLGKQIEIQTRRQEQAREIIVKTRNIAKAVSELAGDIARYATSRDKLYLSRFDQGIESCNQSLTWLAEKLKNDPEQSKLVADIGLNYPRGLAILIATRRAIEDKPLIEAAATGIAARRQMQPLVRQLAPELLALLRRQVKIRHESPAVLSRLHQIKDVVLYAGIAVNVIAMSFAARYVFKDRDFKL